MRALLPDQLRDAGIHLNISDPHLHCVLTPVTRLLICLCASPSIVVGVLMAHPM